LSVCGPLERDVAIAGEVHFALFAPLPGEAKSRDPQNESKDKSSPSQCQGRSLYEVIGRTLLVAMSDYSTDKRGDVGSWVREEAMKGCYILLLLLRGYLAAHSRPDEGAKATLGPASESAASAPPSSALSAWAAEFTQAAISALVQQAMEKINRMRSVAGHYLVAVVRADPPLPFVPHLPALRDLLEELNVKTRTQDWGRDDVDANGGSPALVDQAGVELGFRDPVSSSAATMEGADATDSEQEQEPDVDDTERDTHTERATQADTADWSSPQLLLATAPRLLAMEAYRRHALAGLVVSVGGLTASVVKHAGDALLAFLEAEEDKEAARALRDDVGESEGEAASPAPVGEGQPEKAVCVLAEQALDLLEMHQGDGRVTTPVLKTIEFFCVNMCFASCSESFRATWSQRCVHLLIKEYGGSKDVVKILACVDVFISLLAFPASFLALKVTLSLLCHSFPKVRRVTAEKLYAGLLMLDLGELLESLRAAEMEERKNKPAMPVYVEATPMPLEERTRQLLEILTKAPWDEKLETVRSFTLPMHSDMTSIHTGQTAAEQNVRFVGSDDTRGRYSTGFTAKAQSQEPRQRNELWRAGERDGLLIMK
jgi:hypothetical protein